jgi:hypothetical protein
MALAPFSTQLRPFFSLLANTLIVPSALPIGRIPVVSIPRSSKPFSVISQCFGILFQLVGQRLKPIFPGFVSKCADFTVSFRQQFLPVKIVKGFYHMLITRMVPE